MTVRVAIEAVAGQALSFAASEARKAADAAERRGAQEAAGAYKETAEWLETMALGQFMAESMGSAND